MSSPQRHGKGDKPPLHAIFDRALQLRIEVRLADDGRVRWHYSGRKKKEREKQERLRQAIQNLINEARTLWNDDEWQRAMGLREEHWTRRVILLCRAQVIVAQRNIDAPGQCFIGLPDGQAVSTFLFWPRHSAKITNPLIRLPETVVLVGLNEIVTSEPSMGEWNDSRLADELTGWLKTHGASPEWLSLATGNGDRLSKQHISGLRTKLKNLNMNCLRTATERRKIGYE